MEKGTIKVSVLYPNGEDKTFDMDYYCNNHVALATELLGDALKGATIEKGLGGAAPGSPAPYLAMGNMYFESMEAFGKAFEPNAGKIINDMHNFTNSEPVIQISEVSLTIIK
jgi:uncharacterized protein (TIGR02118 family)